MANVLYVRIGAVICVVLVVWFADLYWIGFLPRWKHKVSPLAAANKSNNNNGPASRDNHRHNKRPPKPPREPPQKKIEIINVTLGDETYAHVISQLLNASLHLIEVHYDASTTTTSGAMTEADTSYQGVTGDFCSMNFHAQKMDPTSVPMFRHVGQKSPECQSTRYRLDLNEWMTHVRQYDAAHDHTIRVLPLGGVIFHASRCGSTTISNALQAMNPIGHRVYSEAQPEMAANLCGDEFQHCSLSQASQLFSDVVYLLSRSNNHDESQGEERVFFKFHSDSTRNWKVFQHAFPKTPWLFVYRDPLHIIVSQFKEGKSIAKCVRTTQSQQWQTLLRDNDVSEASLLSKEQLCAATVGSYFQAALDAMEASSMGKLVAYHPDISDSLISDIFPNTFGLAITPNQESLIRSISSMYSKASHGRARPFQDDSHTKEVKMTPEIKAAIELFAQTPYRKLQEMTTTTTTNAQQQLAPSAGTVAHHDDGHEL